MFLVERKVCGFSADPLRGVIKLFSRVLTVAGTTLKKIDCGKKNDEYVMSISCNVVFESLTSALTLFSVEAKDVSHIFLISPQMSQFI
jgi:hypothetical protein